MARKAEVNKQGIFQGTMIEDGGNVRILGDDLTVNPNILRNSTGLDGTTGWSGLITSLDGGVNGLKKFQTRRTDTTSSSRTFVTQNIYSEVKDWAPGTTFTISGWYYVDSAEPFEKTVNPFIRWQNANNMIDTGFEISPTTVVKDQWIRFEKTYTISTKFTASDPFTSANFYFGGFYTGTTYIYFSGTKIELGPIATPWVPNSADTAYSKLGFVSANSNIHDPIKAEDFYEI